MESDGQIPGLLVTFCVTYFSTCIVTACKKDNVFKYCKTAKLLKNEDENKQKLFNNLARIPLCRFPVVLWQNQYLNNLISTVGCTVGSAESQYDGIPGYLEIQKV